MEYEDIAYGKSLGATGHHENRLIALKWADELYETKFRGLELATTRTSMVSITGLFDPVNINGTYNLQMNCPCCGGSLEERTTFGGTHQLFCGNPHCVARLIQKFNHFCEKTRMDIEGFSAAMLEKFIGHGWIQNFGDLYELEKHHDEIVQTEGFGEKTYERLQASIEKSRRCTLAKFIAGLGVPMVGRHAGRDLDSYFNGSWEAFENAVIDGFDFTRLPDFGITVAECLLCLFFLCIFGKFDNIYNIVYNK